MTKQEIKIQLKEILKDEQKIEIKAICSLDLELSFRLREIVDNYIYYIELLIPIRVDNINMLVVVEQSTLKVSRQYNQYELTDILYDFEQKAQHIKNLINKCKK